jgi:ribonuclease E
LDAELVLEQARQQLAASGTRRRRGRGGRGGAGLTSQEHVSQGQSGEEPGAEAPVQIRSQRELPAMVEITPLPEAHQPETVVTVSVPTVVSIDPPEVELPARRGRTRSSAASNGSDPAAAKATLAVAEPELDEAGEPRRRRRRSSAPT